MNNIKDFTKKLLERAIKKGFSDAEIYISGNSSLGISTLDGEINKFESSSSRGLCFRGTYNNKMGYSYSELISDEAIDIIITEAMQNSEILEEEEQDKLFTGSESYPEIKGFNGSLKNISVDEKINAALSMEKSAKKFNDLIKGVDYNEVEYFESDIMIANTYGMNIEYKSNGSVGYAYARAVKDDETKTGMEFWVGTDWNKFNPEKIGKTASEIAISKLGAKSVKSGQYKIIVQNTAFADFISTFSPVFLADRAQKGLSLLAGKLNEKIASEIFNLKDDPLYLDSIRAVPFDAEGVATYNKSIIENGEFRTFLHNLKTAAKDGVKSTGNASKAGYKSPVKVAPKNLYVVPGKITKEELAEKVFDGIYIIELAGLHSGADEISGDFSIMAEGFLIENGKLASPVEQITIAGNFFDVLKNIEEVADNLRFSSGGVGSPDVYIKSLAVSGSGE
ncbi:MAG: TldD/PmbA family protein [Oscillospiraceae bacterium]|nr:TldD/PmbA family protein [Oscillospiraceae bacterium]